MSTLRANTLKPITSGNSLVLQGDSGGSGVTGVTIDSSGDTILSGDLNPGSGPANFVGLIAPFGKASGTIDGWLYCDGSTVSRSTYSVLFGIIGETWGAGDGSSTFAIPDLEGAFLRGTGNGSINSRTKTGPTNVGDFQEDNFQDHRHQIYGNANLYNSYSMWNGVLSSGALGTVAFGGSGSSLASLSIGPANLNSLSFSAPREGEETRPFNAGVRYYIKY